jgi:hypothetical protein
VSLAAAAGPATTPLPAPPENPIFAHQIMTTKGGYVTLDGYLSEGEWNDPQWRAALEKASGWQNSCPAHQISRVVRWYPSTAIRPDRCAALVTTYRCDAQLAGKPDRIAFLRDQIMMGPIGGNFETSCGTKVRPTSWPNESERRKKIADALEKRLSASVACDLHDADPANPIRISDGTKIVSKTRIHPDLRDAFKADSELLRYAENPESDIKTAALYLSKMHAVFTDEPYEADANDIIIDQSFALTDDGKSYCINLSATQDGNRWIRTIQRSIGETDTMSVATRTRMLARRLTLELAKTLGFPIAWAKF